MANGLDIDRNENELGSEMNQQKASYRSRIIALSDGKEIKISQLSPEEYKKLKLKIDVRVSGEDGVEYVRLKEGEVGIIISPDSKHYKELMDIINSNEHENVTLTDGLKQILEQTPQQINDKINAKIKPIQSIDGENVIETHCQGIPKSKLDELAFNNDSINNSPRKKRQHLSAKSEQRKRSITPSL